jgi:hypothetical protein
MVADVWPRGAGVEDVCWVVFGDAGGLFAGARSRPRLLSVCRDITLLDKVLEKLR